MGTSLRDQLVKAGLATKNDARRAAKQQSKKARQKAAGQDEREHAARQAQAAKVARDRALDRDRKTEADRRARSAEVRQLIERNRLPPVESEDFFNFVADGKIRRLAVTPEHRERIIRGELVIVRDGSSHAIVPAAVAQRIRERDAKTVVTLETSGESKIDDAYSDYVVPDDLMW
jgi:uncharacterized protein